MTTPAECGLFLAPLAVSTRIPLTVTLDLPAPAGTVSVALSTDRADLIDVPTALTIPFRALSANFEIEGRGVGHATVTARMGGNEFVLGVDVVESTGPCLIISEYIEGSSNNKALELTNCSTVPLDLATIGICFETNAALSCSSGYRPSGNLQPAPLSWANMTLRRCNRTPALGAAPFDVATFYTLHPENDFSDLGFAPTSFGCN